MASRLATLNTDAPMPGGPAAVPVGRPSLAPGMIDWRTVALTKQSPVPLYYQLVEQVRELIQTGQLAPGVQLPAERDLAEQTGISRMTARQAISYLVRDGALTVRHGVGTFIAEPKLTYDALHLLGFTEETMRRGDAVASRVIEQALGAPAATIAEALRLGPGERTLKIVRLRAVGETPVLLETSYLPAARCAGLEHADLETHSLYSLLELRYGLRLAEARQVVEATVANEFERGLFGIELGTPMLLVEGVTMADDGAPVECFRAVYRADRVKLALSSRRETGPPLATAASPPLSLLVR